MRAGPAVRFDAVFEFGLAACQIARVCETLDPFGAIRLDDAELEAARAGARFVAKEFAASFKPPEHGIERYRSIAGVVIA